MNQRLKEVRKALGFTQVEFASRLGITQTSYSMIETGTNALTARHIKMICAIFNVDETWLLTGEGEMFRAYPFEEEFMALFNTLAPATQNYLLASAKELLKLQNQLMCPEE